MKVTLLKLSLMMLHFAFGDLLGLELNNGLSGAELIRVPKIVRYSVSMAFR